MKFLKFFMYYVIGFAIYLFIIIMAGDNISPVLRYIGYGLGAFLVIGVIYTIVLFVILRKENLRMYRYIDEEKYDEAIEQANIKLNKKVLFSERKDFYNFIITLAYVSKNDKENAYLHIEKIKDKEAFPVVYYWQVITEFAEGKHENIKEYTDKFLHSNGYYKKPNSYSTLVIMLNAINGYLDNDEEKFKNFFGLIDEKKYSMPSAKKSIQILKEHINKEN